MSDQPTGAPSPADARETTNTNRQESSGAGSPTPSPTGAREPSPGASSRADGAGSGREGASTAKGPGGSGSSGTGSGRRRRRRGGRGRGGKGRSGGQGASPSSGGAGGSGDSSKSPPTAKSTGSSLPGVHDRPERGRDRGEDYTDPAADRALTSDDVAAVARAEAEADAVDRKPKIGDSRPAPATSGGNRRPGSGTGAAATDAGGSGPTQKKRRRRRRRGGRGRGSGSAPTVVDGTVQAGETDVDGTTILDGLDEETLERRIGSTRKGRPAGRYLMVVHVHDDGVAQMSVLEGRNLVEHYVSRPTDDDLQIDGNIYLGRVQNVLPGMEAAFLDIGTPKNAVLYRNDVAYDSEEHGRERPKIERMLKNRQSVLVQVTKNPIGHKGARLTQDVSLAGRFVVMVPGQPKTYGISKRLPDDERRRLRRVLDRLRPDDAGLIVRTAAEGATEDELRRDMERLTGQWREIQKLEKRAKPGSLLYREPPLMVRVIREEFTKEYRGIVIDDETLYNEVRSYVGAVAPELVDRIEFYDTATESLPVLEKFHMHEQLHKALDRKVWLPSGGSLVIEHTEALTVIDVNTAKNVGRSSLEETVYANNLEAADVCARELRLRDIGGIIVIDFIDMEDEKNRREVERAFREALARDKTRTQVYPISELGLLQMTRKRIGEGLVDTMSHTCDQCSGRGYLVDQALLD